MIESSPSSLAHYKDKIKRLFQKAGYSATIYGVVDDRSNMSEPHEGETSLFDQEDVLEDQYFDVVISDVSLSEQPDTLGFSVLAHVKREHPGIFTIAYCCRDGTIAEILVGRRCQSRHQSPHNCPWL
jgi:hypothetical protein